MRPVRTPGTRQAAPRIAGRAIGIAVWALVAGCTAKGNTEGRGGAPRPVPVTVATVVQKDVPVEIRSIGAAEAVSTVAVHPQVSGLVQEVHFKEGDFVKKGTLLFTIDTRPYRASLSAAQAELEKNRALADAAHRELERSEKLLKEGLTSDLDLSQKRANAAALDATLGQNRAAILGSSINVQFAAIRSPIDGRTGSLLVHAGNVVNPVEGRPMVVIRSLEPIHARFAVPEPELAAIRAQQAEGPVIVQATPRGAARPPAEGELTFIENSVDPATGKIDMKALFRNEGQLFWPGQFVDVVIRLSTERGAIVVPEAAIQTGQEGPYTFVVGADMKAAERRVEVKRTLGGEVVIAKGLVPGERVVVDGQVRLRNGAPVTIPPTPGASAAATDAPPLPRAAASAGSSG